MRVGLNTHAIYKFCLATIGVFVFRAVTSVAAFLFFTERVATKKSQCNSGVIMSQKTSSPSPVICTCCGGRIDIYENQKIVECSFCKSKFHVSDLLNESDSVRIERIKAQTTKDIETERMKKATEKEQLEEEKNAVKKFKKGKLSKVLIIFAIISGLVTALELSDGFSMAGLISLIQAILYIIAWLMGMGIIKAKRNFHVLVTVIALVLLIPFFMFFGNSNDSAYGVDAEYFSWTDLELNTVLPEIENPYGEIGHNSTTGFIVTLCDVTEDMFTTYRTACIDAGYVIDDENTDSLYTAYNRDGYNVRLVYYDETMNVYLEAPEEMDEFEWPLNGPGSILPATKSNIGKISWDNSETFIVHVGNTTIDEYKEYVKLCEEYGFNIDYSRDDDFYTALNSDGYKLTLRYLGFDKIEVSVSSPKNEVIETETSELTEVLVETEVTVPIEITDTEVIQPEEAPLPDGMRAEFKAAMDNYEEFFDEYCTFMKKYAASDGTDVTLILEYANFIAQYAECMKDFEAWENEEMNDVEIAYYIEVQTRINQNLIEVAQ